MTFSTTVVCDLKKPDHALDIVAIIAYLVGPLDPVLGTFNPPADKFFVDPPGVGSEPVAYEWVPEPGQSSPVPWKVLERRRDLWGRRTVAIGGQVHQVGTNNPPQPMTMKFT